MYFLVFWDIGGCTPLVFLDIGGYTPPGIWGYWDVLPWYFEFSVQVKAAFSISKNVLLLTTEACI